MSKVQSQDWGLVPVSLTAQLYFNEQGGQCFSGIAKYDNPEAPFHPRQIVLAGKFLNATPPVYGDTVIALESVGAQMHINLLDPDITYGELTIIGTSLQVLLYALPKPSEPDNRLVHAIIFGSIEPVNSEFIIDSVKSTRPLSVSISE